MPIPDALKKEYAAIHAKYASSQDVLPINQRIKNELIQSHLHFLLAKGHGTNAVRGQRKKLYLYWHPDKKSNYTPAMSFIDSRLPDDLASKLIEMCANHVLDPTNHARPGQDQAAQSQATSAQQTMSAESTTFVHDMVHHSMRGRTYGEQIMGRSVLAAMNNANDFVNELERAQDSPIKFIGLLLPALATMYGASFVLPQIAMAVAGSALMSRLFSRIATGTTGHAYQAATNVQLMADEVYYLAMSVPVIIASNSILATHTAMRSAHSARQYITGQQDASSPQPVAIQWMPLRVIAFHLKRYIYHQQNQLAASYREGSSKTLIFNLILRHLLSIDQQANTTPTDKLDQVERLIAEYGSMPLIASSGANAKVVLDDANKALAQARLSLASVPEQDYYNLYQAATLPLRQYVYQHETYYARASQWVRGQHSVSLMQGVLNDVDEIHSRRAFTVSQRQRLIADRISKMYDDASQLSISPAANLAIEQAKGVIVGQSEPAAQASQL